jgi:carbonic anhydrase/acetyltransferase-like protein (isoleucine patch superfamily)
MIKPVIHKDALVAENATVVGNVIIEAEANIWYQTVVRGDTKEGKDGCIQIGKRSNVQDGCVLHIDEGYPLLIGEGVTIGHKAIVHGCSIGDNSLIGMGAIVLNGAKIGKNCMIGAGALVTQNTEIPDGYMAFGSPAKPIRMLTKEEIAGNRRNADFYVEEAKEFYNNSDF